MSLRKPKFRGNVIDVKSVHLRFTDPKFFFRRDTFKYTAAEMASGPFYCRKTMVVFSLKGAFASGHMKDLAFSYSFFPKDNFLRTYFCKIPELPCKIHCCVMCEKPDSRSYLILKVNDVCLG